MAPFHPLRAAAFRKAQEILTLLSSAENLDSLAAHKAEIENLAKLADLSSLLNDLNLSPEEPEMSQILIPEELTPTQSGVELDGFAKNCPQHSGILENNDSSAAEDFSEKSLQNFDSQPEPVLNQDFIEESTELSPQEEFSASDSNEFDNKNEETLPVETEEKSEEESQANKLRLAKIKALKQEDFPAQPDFQSSPNPTPAEERPPLPKEQNDGFHLDFKLDLNDRIAFTQRLFDGSQSDLNHAVQTLNSFRTAEQAQRYLSDLYYERNWQNAEEYAQRLWFLVENKFL